MSKNMYWITDADGTRAVVEGAEERDHWVRVRGWVGSDEPAPQDFVWVHNEHPAINAIRMTWEAAQLPAWAERGWAPGAPPGASPPAETAEPATKSSPAKASATSGESKEKVNG